MARVKISEYQAKKLLFSALGISWQGMAANKHTTAKDIKKYFSPSAKLVVKVDQGVKGRGKKGLVKVNVSSEQSVDFIQQTPLYEHFLIEEVIVHEQKDEQYLALERVREGIRVLYSDKGGVEVEGSWGEVREMVIPFGEIFNFQFSIFNSKNPEIQSLIQKLITVFEKYYFSFLEINPLVVTKDKISILDLAVEVDDAALSLLDLPLEPVAEATKTVSELAVAKLDLNTPASLKYRIIIPDGAIWMLLSGGGASLVLADEIADLGMGKQLANYGEYSGNPSREDTYLYTKTLLQDLLKSFSVKKVLIIAGGVANFTDVKKTFLGVIDALEEVKVALKKQQVKVFVRRGGPNQEAGLKLMRYFLEKAGILGAVWGPEEELTKPIQNLELRIKN